MPLVQLPVLGHRHPQTPHRFKREIQRLDRARLNAGKGGVGRYTLCFHKFTRCPSLRRALFGNVYIPPAGKAVFKVPL